MAVPVTIPRVVSRGVSRYVPSRAYGGGLADALIGSESQGLAVDFTDFSMVIRDTGTPANNFSGNPNSKLTYSSPSTKWILGSNGLYQSGTTLRTEYNSSGVALGVRIEEARTNVVLHNRDLTNVAWTKTNTTAAKDQTGIDGVANSASSLTATAGNGTCLQAITLASSARYQSAFVKRITGSGTINMTMDNGTTWTAVTVTASWTKVEIPTQTLANPTVGFRIVTSGDAIAIDMVGNENGTFSTSPIVTAGSTVTRAADNISATDVVSWLNGTLTQHYKTGIIGYSTNMISLETGNSASGEFSRSSGFYNTTTNFIAIQRDGAGATINSNSMTIISPVGRTIKVATVYATNDMAYCVDGTIGNVDAVGTIGTSANKIWIGRSYDSQLGAHHLKQVMILPRRMSNADMQTLTT